MDTLNRRTDNYSLELHRRDYPYKVLLKQAGENPRYGILFEEDPCYWTLFKEDPCHRIMRTDMILVLKYCMREDLRFEILFKQLIFAMKSFIREDNCRGDYYPHRGSLCVLLFTLRILPVKSCSQRGSLI